MRIALLGLGLAAALASPASAVELAAGANGPITVYGNGAACAAVTAAGTFAGQLTATGTVTKIIQDGVMTVEPIVSVVPFTGSGSATVCTAASPDIARSGAAVYEITVTSVAGDYVQARACVFNAGRPACDTKSDTK